MKVLITGINGFIGTHIAQFFKSKGVQIYGWDISVSNCINNNVSVIDLLDYDRVEENLKLISPDIIFHCAGSADVNKSVLNPLRDVAGNYITTHNILFALKKLNIRSTRFVLLSSAAVYGNPRQLPITENAEKLPLSPYALHKRAAEEACEFMSRNYEIDTKVLRIFSAYGPGLRKQIFWDMYQKVCNNGELNMWGSGYESRDYIYIDDLVNAITIVALSAPQNEIFYNIANGEEVQIRTVAYKFASLMDLPAEKIHFIGERREGDPINWRADITRLKKLGYQRKVGLEDGIEKYVEWAKQQGI